MRYIRRVEEARRERAHILECEREDFGRRHRGRRRADVGIGARELGHGYGCARREQLRVGHRPVLPRLCRARLSRRARRRGRQRRWEEV